MRVKLTYEYRCGLCGATHTEEHNLGKNYAIPNPCIPENWFEFNREIYCPKHEVRLLESDRTHLIVEVSTPQQQLVGGE